MINRLSNFINSRRIKDDIENIIQNQNNEDILKKPVIKLTDNRLEMLSYSGYSYDYDLENDNLTVSKEDAIKINISNFENEIKSLIKENIVIPLQEQKLQEEKELEIKQQAIYTEIKSRLNQSNYTPHNHFKDINSWNQEQFENFINKFNQSEISKFKEVLLDCARSYEDQSLSGERMNKTFDDIAIDHRNMFKKIENSLTEQSHKKIKHKI